MENTHWAAIFDRLPNKRRIDRRLFVRFRSNKTGKGWAWCVVCLLGFGLIFKF